MISYKRSSVQAATQCKCAEWAVAAHAGHAWPSISGLHLGQADLPLLKSGSKEKSRDKEIIKRTVKSRLPAG